MSKSKYGHIVNPANAPDEQVRQEIEAAIAVETRKVGIKSLNGPKPIASNNIPQRSNAGAGGVISFKDENGEVYVLTVKSFRPWQSTVLGGSLKVGADETVQGNIAEQAMNELKEETFLKLIEMMNQETLEGKVKDWWGEERFNSNEGAYSKLLAALKRLESNPIYQQVISSFKDGVDNFRKETEVVVSAGSGDFAWARATYVPKPVDISAEESKQALSEMFAAMKDVADAIKPDGILDELLVIDEIERACVKIRKNDKTKSDEQILQEVMDARSAEGKKTYTSEQLDEISRRKNELTEFTEHSKFALSKLTGKGSNVFPEKRQINEKDRETIDMFTVTEKGKIVTQEDETSKLQIYGRTTDLNVACLEDVAFGTSLRSDPIIEGIDKAAKAFANCLTNLKDAKKLIQVTGLNLEANKNAPKGKGAEMEDGQSISISLRQIRATIADFVFDVEGSAIATPQKLAENLAGKVDPECKMQDRESFIKQIQSSLTNKGEEKNAPDVAPYVTVASGIADARGITDARNAAVYR